VTAVIALRGVHFAAAVTLFGELLFALLLVRPDALAWRRLLRVAAWSLAILVVSGALWVGAQAQAMSGAPLAPDVLRAVLGETLFGRVSVLRFALAAALAAALLLPRRARPGGPALLGAAALLAGALLATLAWTGHAAAEAGADRAVHLSADVLHLLAAGAWVGALWPLAAALRAADAAPERAARRFSALGMVCVGALIATGVANAWYTVGSLPAMIGTGYGRLLSLKLALFAAMLALAAVNRWRLTPRLARDTAARARLRGNAAAEAALGLAVLGVVGALGATVPALHEQTGWPFPYTLDLDAARGAEALLGALLVVPLIALPLLIAGARGRRVLGGAGAALLAAALASGVWLLAAPAHPTTYLRSPVRYAADSIARGAGLYREHCAECHGPRAHGDGPAAASLPVRPLDLAAHGSQHREGDLYWWVERGIPGTPMPGYAGAIPESGVWDILNLVRAEADADAARALSDRVQPGVGVPAPDFVFQIGTRPQESLADLRGRETVLLVFYEMPGSLARLRALAGIGAHWRHVGVRVVAFPVRGRAAKPGAGGGAEMLADADPRVAAAYALFAPGGAAQPVEFLIDRRGDLRARWVPGATPGWSAMPALLEQVEVLEREPPRPLARRRHAH
jgi:copper resistance protein D